MKWQSISEAPKDGTQIVAWREDAGLMIAFYGTCEHLCLTDREIEEIDEDTYFAESWWTFAQDGAFRLEGDEAPTHWFPLAGPTIQPQKDQPMASQ